MRNLRRRADLRLSRLILFPVEGLNGPWEGYPGHMRRILHGVHTILWKRLPPWPDLP